MNSTEIKIIEIKIKDALQKILDSVNKEQRALDDSYKEIANNQLLERVEDKSDFLNEKLASRDKVVEKKNLTWSQLDELKEKIEDQFDALIDILKM